MIKNDSTTAINRGFLYIGIKTPIQILLLPVSVKTIWLYNFSVSDFCYYTIFVERYLPLQLLDRAVCSVKKGKKLIVYLLTSQ